MPTQVFISHVMEDAAVAARLKRKMTEDFLGQLTVFLSSDTESIAAGEEWLSSVSEALRNSSIFVVLCSPMAIARPWVNFEAGAAWMRIYLSYLRASADYVRETCLCLFRLARDLSLTTHRAYTDCTPELRKRSTSSLR